MNAYKIRTTETFGLTARRALRLCTLALLCSCVFIFILKPAGVAQFGQTVKDQVFDYDPQSGGDQVPQIATITVSVEYTDAEIINDPVQGVVILPKNRWKNWVLRAVYLLLLDAAVIVIILSLPKNEEYNIMIAYALSGASFVLSFWVFLCAVVLFQLRAAVWLYILPMSLAMGVMCVVILKKIKLSDASLLELKESFQKSTAAAKADNRLISVEGVPGEWPDTDFLK